MIKVGQIGHGRFGEKILSKLQKIKDVSIEWVYASQDEWFKNTLDVDWVIVATPHEFHYEQAKHFLKSGVNVFCEKPATLSTESLRELISIADENDAKFYIDDVLTYEKIEPTNSFIYKKWGDHTHNLIDRIAYHHFYLIYNQIGNAKPSNIEIQVNEPFCKVFKLKFDNQVYNFEYDFKWYKEKINSLHYGAKRDALEAMLSVVLSQNVDFKSNHERSLFATTISEYVKERLYVRCAVVGAGIYGITTALKLKAAGYPVDLYEAGDDIMKAASGINQYRLHRGYHYPRSFETMQSCKAGRRSFIKYYRQAVESDNIKHYYAIALQDSLITPEAYLTILDKANLEWEIVDSLPNCGLTIQVKENLYDPRILTQLCRERLVGCGVNLILNKKVRILKDYEHVVYATYSTLNEASGNKKNYQFELCEKPVLKLPQQYKDKSIVIMDGPFMCFDPLKNTEYHLAGNVVHAIHIRNTGIAPEIPSMYKKYLNNGIIKDPKYTNIDRFIKSAKTFFPDIEKAEHIGSMYTIRTVLPHKDSTDERPTIIAREKNNFIVFSGKIGNCVDAANEIVQQLIELKG